MGAPLCPPQNATSANPTLVTLTVPGLAMPVQQPQRDLLVLSAWLSSGLKQPWAKCPPVGPLLCWCPSFGWTLTCLTGIGNGGRQHQEW